MSRAHLLINAEIGSEESVLQDLAHVPGVREPFVVYGVYDIVCVLERSTPEELSNVIRYTIRGLPNVRITMTFLHTGESYFRNDDGNFVQGYRPAEDTKKKPV